LVYAECRVSRPAGVKEGEKLVVVNSGAGSQHGFRPELPSQTGARLKILFGDVEKPVPKERFGGGHVISIKANTASSVVRLRRIGDRFPAQAEIERHTGAQPNIILSIGGQQALTKAQVWG